MLFIPYHLQYRRSSALHDPATMGGKRGPQAALDLHNLQLESNYNGEVCDICVRFMECTQQENGDHHACTSCFSWPGLRLWER